MPVITSENISPGLKLRNYLSNIYPKNTGGETAFLSRLDKALLAKGEFIDLAYNSSINYMVRRLINTAEFIRAQTEESSLFIYRLKSFLKEEMEFTKEQVEALTSLLKECSDVSQRDIAPSVRTTLIDEVSKAKTNAHCYICGKSLDISSSDGYTLDHLWPQSLGGQSDISNLQFSCSDCNKRKGNIIDSSDYHYEQFSLTKIPGDNEFERKFTGEFRIALVTRNSFKCSNCEKEISDVGALDFERKNLQDSWHFLNVDAYCKTCIKFFRRGK